MKHGKQTGSQTPFRQETQVMDEATRHRLYRSISLDDARLFVIEGPHEGEQLKLDRGILQIGKGPLCDLSLERDEWISKQHCEILLDDDRIRVRDCGSRNGVFLDGNQVFDGCLRAGSRLQMGNTVLELRTSARRAQIKVDFRDPSGLLIGRSESMQRLFARLARVARYDDISVLLQGETGTGKTLTARALHNQSPRKDRPFVVVDCSTIRPELLESELFGHVKGAFTGATADKMGLLSAADGGTLFLDEIGELSPDAQASLLTAADTGCYRRLGENKERTSDFRLIAATLKPLEEEVRANRFREDLYFRIATVKLELPPLRERLDDLSYLIQGILHQLGKEFPEDPEIQLGEDAIHALQQYIWPGNIRELRNVLKRAWIFRSGDLLTADDLDLHLGSFVEGQSPNSQPLQTAQSSQETMVVGEGQILQIAMTREGQPHPIKELLDEAERAIIGHYLAQTYGNVEATAEKLQMSRGWCYNRIKKHKLKERGKS